MPKPQVGVTVSPEDLAFLDELAVKFMSYRSTIAQRLLKERIAQLRAENAAPQNTEGEENQNG